MNGRRRLPGVYVYTQRRLFFLRGSFSGLLLFRWFFIYILTGIWNSSSVG